MLAWGPHLWHLKGAHPQEKEAMRQLLESLDSDITITEDITPGRHEEFTQMPTPDDDPDE